MTLENAVADSLWELSTVVDDDVNSAKMLEFTEELLEVNEDEGPLGSTEEREVVPVNLSALELLRDVPVVAPVAAGGTWTSLLEEDDEALVVGDELLSV
jgi:hypothetical protein